MMRPDEIRIGDLSRLLGPNPAALRVLAKGVARRYHNCQYQDGDKLRVLTIPDDTLKQLQRRIYSILLAPLPVNACVHSTRGFSILTNARAHMHHPYLSAFDIRDCFPSITPIRVRKGLLRHGFRPDVASILTRLTTLNGELPLGAPTSPALLNVVLTDCDAKIGDAARRNGLTFTRYVDDLYLSGGERTPTMARYMESVLARHHLEVKAAKRFDWGPDDQHTVTRIVVNTRPCPLPEYTKSLKEIIQNHANGTEELTEEDLTSVRGQIAYVGFLDKRNGRRLANLLKDQS